MSFAGSDAHKTENSEKNMLETEMEKELICSQYESDTVIKTEDALIVDAQDVVNSWTAEEPSEAANINTEVNEEQHMAVDMENKPDEINAIISQNDCQEFDSDSEETKSPSLVSDLTLDEDHGIPVEEFNSTQAFYEKTPTPLSPCISAAKDSNVFKDCQELAQQESPCMVSDSTLDDDHEIPAEEFDNSIQTAALSPCIAVAKVCSPFAGNTIQGQFPRPTSAAPNKQPTLEIDINKENTNSGRDVDYKELLNEMSLRQLNKALREKLQIKNNVVPKVN